MHGWQIFRHSVRMVIDNLEAAFRLSVVLYAIQALNQVLLMMAAPAEATADAVMTPGMAFLVLVTSLVALMSSLWIAVAWHRYVLTGEGSEGALPPWHGGLVLAYLGRSLMIGLLISVALVATMIPGAMVMAAAPGTALPVLLTVACLMVYLFFRFSVLLPAGAVDRKMTLREAWTATAGEHGSILTLSMIVVGVVAAVQVPSMLNPDPQSLINLVYTVVVGWFVTMIGISILTTLYGMCVEARDID